MTVSLDRIRRDYLALLGESPGLSPVLEPGEESGVLELEELLKVRLEALAVEATLATPPLWLDEISRSEPETEWEGGACRLRLPSDYLRLYSLRMEGWKEDVREPEPAGSLRDRLGMRCPDWMACTDNPLVKEGRDADGPYLMVKGVSGMPSSPELLLYVPKPRLTEKKLRISGAAYPRLLELLVREGISRGSS